MKTNKFQPFTVPAGAGCTVITQEQALSFLTPAEIEAGEKRFETSHFGPWQILSKLSGVATVCTWKPGPCGQVMDTLTVIGPRSLDKPRSMGYDMEGATRYNGGRFRAFTSSRLFQIEGAKELVQVAILHVCQDQPKVKKPA